MCDFSVLSRLWTAVRIIFWVVVFIGAVMIGVFIKQQFVIRDLNKQINSGVSATSTSPKIVTVTVIDNYPKPVATDTGTITMTIHQTIRYK